MGKYLRWLLLLGSGAVRGLCEDVFTLPMMNCGLGVLETWYYWIMYQSIYFVGLWLGNLHFYFNSGAVGLMIYYIYVDVAL